MRISIITVSYNSEQFIKTCINSVLSQKYKDVEYIIIDGNSSDNTKDIISSYGSNVAKFLSEPDKGIYDAMNKGVLLATGDIIGILNSDDIYQDQDVITDVVNVFLSDPKLDILYGNIVYVKRDDTEKIVRYWKSSPYNKNFFETGNVPPHPALFVRSEVYRQAGLFDLQYSLAADYEFMLRIFKKYNFKSKYFDRLIIKMRLGGATNQSISNIIAGNKEILRSWRNNGFTPPFYLMPLKFFKRLLQFI